LPKDQARNKMLQSILDDESIRSTQN
jgi:hypothetical protein